MEADQNALSRLYCPSCFSYQWKCLTMQSIAARIASELTVRPEQVAATVALLDEGASVPFIARYRKEVTGSLDDTQLRYLEERLRYLRELEDRRSAVLSSIAEQGKLSPELERDIREADTKTRLEDLYLPYKPKRRTKGQIAIEAGLEPLADALFDDPTLDPEQQAAAFVDADKGVADVKAALDGAKYILMERFAENASLLERLRSALREDGRVASRVVSGKEQEGAKFADYFEYDEPLKKVPSHRALAILRGRNEGVLSIALELGDAEPAPGSLHPCEGLVAETVGISNQGRAADRWLNEVVRWTWRVKLLGHLETELLGELREAAEDEAIRVFASNLKDLLLSAPAGQRVTLGLDPGLRTGVKVVVVNATGKLLDTATIFPHAPRNDWDRSLATLAALCSKHEVSLIAVGNGTASRETDKLAADLIKLCSGQKMQKVMVSEAGASVYSASELAAREFPDLDVTYRGAVSIARRLQDPLAELVKIEPKAIGVGQYQHDVSQVKLARGLDAVVEDCVNAVGVDLNTASAALLTRVSGLNPSIAQNIVDYRDNNGAFRNRRELLKVSRLGEKTFEQAAGFLRVMSGDNPLDASAVHPEAYPLVERIAGDTGRDVRGLIGDSTFLRKLEPARYTDERFGIPTITDVLRELDKPGRDPRPEFKAAEFQEGVESLKDLKPGMTLEGVVTNVANFGAFVDIGVHQDGLVHISMLSQQFVKDPRDVVKAGDIVKVKVLEVDIPRQRISLTMRMDDKPQPASERTAGERPRGRHNASRGGSANGNNSNGKPGQGSSTGTFANLFANAKNLKKK